MAVEYFIKRKKTVLKKLASDVYVPLNATQNVQQGRYFTQSLKKACAT